MANVTISAQLVLHLLQAVIYVVIQIEMIQTIVNVKMDFFDDGTKVCKPCNFKCTTCSGSATSCTLCSDTNRNSSPNTCLCKIGYFEKGIAECGKCQTQCSKCSGSDDNCTECADLVNRA